MGKPIFCILILLYMKINAAQILDWELFSEQINAGASDSSAETQLSRGLISFTGDGHEYSEIINKPLSMVHDKLCICPNTHFDQKAIYDHFKDQTINRENPYDLQDLLLHKDKPPGVDQDVSLSKDKQSPKELNNPATSDSTSAQDELFPEPFDTGLVRKSRICIKRRDAYEDCKVACRDACEIMCAKYGCIRKLYKKIRAECKKRCRHYI